MSRDADRIERSPASVDQFRPLFKHVLWGFAVALIVAFLAVTIISQTNALPSIDWSFSPGWLLLSLVLLVAFQGAHAELWRRILEDLGGHMPARKAWTIFNVGLLARYVPTQVLLVVTRVAMAEREGVPRRVTLASIAYEIAMVVAASVVVGAFGLTALPALRGEPWRWAVLLIPVAALVCLHPRVFSHAAGIILRRIGADRLPTTLSFVTVLRLFVLYVLSFVVAGLGVFCFVRSLHTVAAGDVVVAVSAWSVGYAASVLLFFVPGGLGVRDGAMATVLATVVPTAVAVAAAVALRLIQTGIELLYAGASVLYARRLPELHDDRKAEVSRSEAGVPIS
jgi:uncharacterized membrane protein YbhN (UPF0104 family)